MVRRFRILVLVALPVFLSGSAGTAHAGIEPSPWAVAMGSGFDNPIFWVLFNPQPEPPGYEMVEMSLDTSIPTAPRFMVNNDSNGLFHIEFAIENASGPFSGFQYTPVGNSMEISALSAGETLYTAELSFASESAFLMPGADVMFNPQPEPPGFPGFLVDFSLHSLPGGPPFSEGSPAELTLRLAGGDGQLIALYPVPASSVPPIATGGTEGFIGSIPNPSSLTVSLWYRLSRDGAGRLEIFDAGGQKVHSHDLGQVGAGTHSCVWDGRSFEGIPVSTGVYFARLTAGDGCWTRTLIRVR